MKVEGFPLIIYSLLFLLLLICSVDDIQKKTIHLKKLIIFVIPIVIVMLIRSDISIIECLAGMIIGVVFIFISKVTHGEIGIGDGLLLAVTGLGLGIWKNLEMLCYALLFAAIYSIILLIRNFKNRKRKIPFVPFLFLGYVCCIIASGILRVNEI